MFLPAMSAPVVKRERVASFRMDTCVTLALDATILQFMRDAHEHAMIERAIVTHMLSLPAVSVHSDKLCSRAMRRWRERRDRKNQ